MCDSCAEGFQWNWCKKCGTECFSEEICKLCCSLLKILDNPNKKDEKPKSPSKFLISLNLLGFDKTDSNQRWTTNFNSIEWLRAILS